jgi:hypothetical protein
MSDAKDFLIGFDSLIKNRLGPYHIVLKNEQNEYICSGYRSFNRELAYFFDRDLITRCFIPNNQSVFKDRGEKTFIFLTTVAGDIEISLKQFNKKVKYVK